MTRQVTNLKSVASDQAAEKELGTNIRYSIVGNELTIKIDLAHRAGKSASGKTTIVATSSGNTAIGDTGVILGLNAYVK